MDGATVKVGVEVYDLDTARLSVSAKQYGVDNGEMAKYVLDKIVRALEETAP